MLPGLYNPMPTRNLTSFSLFNNTIVATNSITLNAGIRKGDFLLAMLTNHGGEPTSWPTPAGWTLGSKVPGASWSTAIGMYSKIATAADAGTSVVFAAGTIRTYVRVLVLRPVGVIRTVSSAQGIVAAASNVGNVTTRTVTATEATATLSFCMATYEGTNSVTWTTLTGQTDGASTVGISWGIKRRTKADTDSTGLAFDTGDQGNDNMILGMYFSFT